MDQAQPCSDGTDDVCCRRNPSGQAGRAGRTSLSQVMKVDVSGYFYGYFRTPDLDQLDLVGKCTT